MMSIFGHSNEPSGSMQTRNSFTSWTSTMFSVYTQHYGVNQFRKYISGPCTMLAQLESTPSMQSHVQTGLTNLIITLRLEIY